MDQFKQPNNNLNNAGQSQYGRSQYTGLQNNAGNFTNLSNQAGAGQFNPAGNQFGQNQIARSQYTGLQNDAGASQYAQNNNYYQSSMSKGGGVNQYGAQYRSGNRDEDVGNSFYQSTAGNFGNLSTQAGAGLSTPAGNQLGQNQYGRSQYTGLQNNPGASQYAQNNNYYQSSMSKGGGLNQYGAQYRSGNRDEDVGNAYYQSTAGNFGNLSNQAGAGLSTPAGNQYGRSQYTGLQNNPGASQYAQNNNYYQSSMSKGGGLNQYGAQYRSGNRDEDVGNAYYQSTAGNFGNLSNQAGAGLSTPAGNQLGQNQYGRSQYAGLQNNAGNFTNLSNQTGAGQFTPTTNQFGQNQIARSQYTGLQNDAGASQYAQNNNYYQSSMSKGGGLNQYGAQYRSGNRDEDVGNAYYQTNQTIK